MVAQFNIDIRPISWNCHISFTKGQNLPSIIYIARHQSNKKFSGREQRARNNLTTYGSVSALENTT